jgi:8-oxo-dGTP pyrophosphatase MutT (NUDIX family)
MTAEHCKWTTLESVKKYCRETLEVCEDKVIDPRGHPANFSTVKMPPGVCVLPFDDDGFVYLTREYRYALGRESVEVVGGVVEDEELPLAAAKRELKEELGIEAVDFTYLGFVDPVTSVIRSPVHFFLAGGLRFGSKEPDSHEEIATVKLALEEAVRMVNRSEITHAESCVLLLKVFFMMQNGETETQRQTETLPDFQSGN